MRKPARYLLLIFGAMSVAIAASFAMVGFGNATAMLTAFSLLVGGVAALGVSLRLAEPGVERVRRGFEVMPSIVRSASAGRLESVKKTSAEADPLAMQD